MYAPPAALFTPADSARAVADMYSISLIATLPVVAAAILVLGLRESSAGARAIIWRCMLVSVLAIYLGRFAPWQWIAWVLPDPLARPLVSLGTITLDTPPGVVALDEPLMRVSGGVAWLLVGYGLGVVVILLRTVAGRIRLALVRRNATTLGGQVWRTRIGEAGDAVGVSVARVRLASSSSVSIPLTWGVWRPVILLPASALDWPVDRVQAVLRHELAHVRAGDAAMRLTARIACAVLWFHPGVWWMARRLEADAEEAADNRVLRSGTRASDYAEWLGVSAPNVHGDVQPAMAFVRRGNLRARLAAVTDTRRDISAPTRRVALFAVALTAATAAPLATARLAPTRTVLTGLMSETRWESRAWAVVHLARRADSVDVARSAARHDPDPAVRAWARYALGLSPATSVSRPRS